MFFVKDSYLLICDHYWFVYSGFSGVLNLSFVGRSQSKVFAMSDGIWKLFAANLYYRILRIHGKRQNVASFLGTYIELPNKLNTLEWNQGRNHYSMVYYQFVLRYVPTGTFFPKYVRGNWKISSLFLTVLKEKHHHQPNRVKLGESKNGQSSRHVFQENCFP